MYLKKIYSEPEGLFQPTEFVPGINFVYGKKDDKDEPKNSLNSIGKSTFLDLIDFCLLSSYQPRHNPRLYAARDIMLGYKIVLEFEINEKSYTIKRSVEKPDEIEFIDEGKLKTYEIGYFRDMFCDLVFYNSTYSGYYSNIWFRKLIAFFLKIEKFKKQGFADPIQYIRECSISELNQYHLFLMNINNMIARDNYRIQEELKLKEPAIQEVTKYIEEKHNLRNISEATNQINQLSMEIARLEKAVDVFKLSEQYGDAENQANSMTSRIKELWYENYAERSKANTYKNSYKLDVEVNPTKIKNLYAEFNQLLAENIKKTLQDAIEFRKQISQSRKEFISDEIRIIENKVKKNEDEIKTLESKRTKLFDFLSAKEAIKDLTEALYAINEKKLILGDLEGQINIYKTLVSERADLEIEEKKLEKEVLTFIDDVKTQIADFHETFTKIYNAIYPESKNASLFSITSDFNTNSKIDINISFPDMYGKGKNQIRTLVYDLSMLFNAIEKRIPSPRFLVHDGVFDGVDKAHFIALYEFLEEMKLHNKFQYIVTLNEEGTLSEKFGHAEKVSPEKIGKEAIITLTPKHKLFGKDFKNIK